MKKTLRVSLSVLVFVLAFGASAPFAFAAITTAVVTPSDQQGWVFNGDPANATPFEFNLDKASIGLGSLFVEPISSTPAHKFIATKILGIPVADVSSVAYDFLIAGDGTNADANQFYLNIYTITNPRSSTSFYDCRFDYVPGTGSTTNFMNASFNATDIPNHVEAKPGATCPTTLAGMPADSTVSFIALNVGDTSADDTDLAGYLDKVVISTTSDVTTYDFDPDTATLVSNSESEFYMTIQAAITGTNAGGTINVPAGTYSENIIIDHDLTLNGPNMGIIGSGSRVSEATVSQMNITASNVVVDGFSFSNPGIQMNVFGATVLSGVRVQNSIFSGYNSVGFPTYKAGNLVVARNLFQNPLANTEAMQIKDNDSGGCTGTVVSDNVFTAASNNGAADINFSCTGSGSTNVTVSGNTDTGLADAGGTSFTAFSGVTGGILVTNNHVIGTPTSGSAIFFFGGVTGSVNISNNVITGGGGNAIAVRNILEGNNTGTFTISNNDLSGNNRSVSLGNAFDSGATVTIHQNKLSENTTVGIQNDSVTLAVDAINNWWGTASSTQIAASIIGSVIFDPWYINPNRTVLSNAVSGTGEVISTSGDFDVAGDNSGQADIPAGVTNITLGNDTVLDLSSATSTMAATDVVVGGETVTLTQSVVLQSGVDTQPIVLTNSSVADVSVSIPDGTTIQGPAEWDGTITPPVSEAPSGNAPAGFSVGSTVISIGSPDGTLVFNSPVTILLENVTGAVGYKPAGSDTWIQITNVCSGPYATPGNPPVNGECAISNGTDTKILTYHFTTFGGLNPIPPTPSGGGGGWFGGPQANPNPVTLAVSGATPTITAQGQVLGAATFNFSKALTIGVRSDEVTELQKVLIAEGLLKISVPTGYFGQLTKTAVMAFQKARGIASTGFVGPLTRGELNRGAVATTSTGSKLSSGQASAILGLLQAFGAEASVVANVKASLGL